MQNQNQIFHRSMVEDDATSLCGFYEHEHIRAKLIQLLISECDSIEPFTYSMHLVFTYYDSTISMPPPVQTRASLHVWRQQGRQLERAEHRPAVRIYLQSTEAFS